MLSDTSFLKLICCKRLAGATSTARATVYPIGAVKHYGLCHWTLHALWQKVLGCLVLPDLVAEGRVAGTESTDLDFTFRTCF